MAFKKGIIVSNALPELKEKLSGMGKFEAVRPYAAGVVEGLKHYFKLCMIKK
jgi:hydroxymethylpyrimidine pyrophosphatase-like HAD family hydrolase